jgi:hypothetical protein
VWPWTFGFRNAWLVNKSAGLPPSFASRQFQRNLRYARVIQCMPSWSSCSAKLQMLDQHQPGLVQARVPPRKSFNCCRALCILADAGPETAQVATPSNGEDRGPAGTVFVNMAHLAAPPTNQYHTLSVQAHANSIHQVHDCTHQSRRSISRRRIPCMKRRLPRRAVTCPPNSDHSVVLWLIARQAVLRHSAKFTFLLGSFTSQYCSQGKALPTISSHIWVNHSIFSATEPLISKKNTILQAPATLCKVANLTAVTLNDTYLKGTLA